MINLPYEDHTIDGVSFRMIPWKYIKAAMSEATNEARDMADRDWTYSCHRSNGFNFAGIDARDECIHEPGLCDNVLNTKREFIADVARIMRDKPKVVAIELDVTYDSAANVKALWDCGESGDFDPQTGYCTTPAVAWRIADAK